MSVFSRLANLARGQVKVMRKRWTEPERPAPDEVEELEAAIPAAQPSEQAVPAVDPAPEAPEPPGPTTEPRKRRL